jgi:hypothetical protein
MGFFAEKLLNTGRHSKAFVVMSYFHIRRSLTRRDLRKLTSFSAGAISKAVRQLVDMNVITREVILGTQTHIYKMETLPFRSPSYFLQTEQILEKLPKELNEIKGKLGAHGGEMWDQEGHQKAYVFVTYLLELISSVPRFMALIEEELDKFIQ